MGSDTRDNIAPGLLIAMPQLRDPNFARSVVLLLQHDEDGSFGVVVNNPIRADVTLQSSDGEQIPIVENVFLGGPVSPHVCMVLHGDDWRGERTQTIVAGLCVSEPSSAVPNLLEQDDIPFRFVMGYAGWGPGQLQEELSRGSWLCGLATADLILRVDAKEQWATVIRSLGIDPMMLVPATTTQ